MWALVHPCRSRPRPFLADTPAPLLAALACLGAAVQLVARQTEVPPGALRVVGVAAGHGGLLATALAWAGLNPRHGLVVIALLAIAAAASTLGPAGSFAYLAPPLWVARLAWSGRLAALGLAGAGPGRALLAAGALGAVLGGHLLVAASLSLGVHVRIGRGGAFLDALAYDIGANVLAAEAFFRGALFNRAQRRWSLAVALPLATVAYVTRYLVDPLLPKSIALVVGAAFYLTLLSAGNCWLFWWSGSLVPGVVSALLFFVAYRLLETGA